MIRKKGGKAGFENPYCGPSIAAAAAVVVVAIAVVVSAAPWQ